MLPADYHMHTPLCHHAVGEPTEYAAHAVKVGLKEIGLSSKKIKALRAEGAV